MQSRAAVFSASADRNAGSQQSANRRRAVAARKIRQQLMTLLRKRVWRARQNALKYAGIGYLALAQEKINLSCIRVRSTRFQ